MMAKFTQITLILFLMSFCLASAVVITGQGSSYSFTIENCTSPQENLTIDCNATTIRFECDIYNPAFINQVEYRINDVDYVTQQNGTNPKQFYYNYNKPSEGITNTEPIILDRERITDTNNKAVNAYEYIEIQHNCQACPAEMIRTPLEPCQTNDSQRILYNSTNETCALSYETTETCNYCSPNLFQNTTECSFEGEQTITYIDFNETTCCLMTGLVDDCPTYYYPYNQSYVQECDYYKKEINCTADNTPVLNDKINLVCTMPDEQEYCCVVNTYQGNNLLATTPEYKEATQSIISLTSQQETRTCFAPNQNLLNAYYTKKELRPETEYRIEVLCTSTEGDIIRYQTPIIPSYHEEDWLIHRVSWFGQKPSTYIITFLVLLAISLFIIWIIKKARG